MKLHPKTLLLAFIAAGLAVLNLWEPAAPSARVLPSLAPFAVDEVTRFTLSTPVDKIELRRTSPPGTKAEEAKWEIVTPLQFGADAAQVRSLLRSFGAGVPMEAYVDEGHLEDYAVDHQYGRLLEVFTDGDQPVVSVTIGKTAAGGTTFVRISGAEEVYRADVGGRARFDRPAADWRDKMALDIDRAQVLAVAIHRGAEVLHFRRGASEAAAPDGAAIPGPWEMEGAPFPVDSETIESLVRTLTRLRAGEVHNPDYPGGFDPPAAVAELSLTSGDAHRVRLGTADDDQAAFVKVDDRTEVFQVSGQVRRQLLSPVESLRSRQLLKFDRKEVESLALVDGGLTVVLSQGEDATSWNITQPPNMATDQRQALFTVNTLANLRAFDVAPDLSFQPGGGRFEVRFRDGRRESLELGQVERDEDNQPVVRVRVGGQAAVYRLKQVSLAELRKAFGRG